MIGVQVEMPLRDDPGGDGQERAPVERMRLGAGDRLAVQTDRSVFVDFDAHARHAAHRLEIRHRRADGFGRLEQHPVADLRRLAEQRKGA